MSGAVSNDRRPPRLRPSAWAGTVVARYWRARRASMALGERQTPRIYQAKSHGLRPTIEAVGRNVGRSGQETSFSGEVGATSIRTEKAGYLGRSGFEYASKPL